jgi:hypothetical protein
MTRQDLGQIKKLAEVYSKNKTFTYIKEKINVRINFYNGFVVKVYDDMILFYDKLSKKEFPILFETIEVIEPSRREEVEDGRLD